MSKTKKFKSWRIMEGSTKTVFDRETGEASEEIVSPWVAEYVAPFGKATLHAGSMKGILDAIAGHPFENGRAPSR